MSKGEGKTKAAKKKKSKQQTNWKEKYVRLILNLSFTLLKSSVLGKIACNLLVTNACVVCCVCRANITNPPSAPQLCHHHTIAGMCVAPSISCSSGSSSCSCLFAGTNVSDRRPLASFPACREDGRYRNEKFQIIYTTLKS